MKVVLVAMDDVLEILITFFVDKDGQNLLVDVEEIFESLLGVQKVGDLLFVVENVPD